MTKGEFIDKFSPCAIGAAWLVDNCENLEQAWIECPRGDWLVWVAIQLEIDEKVFTLNEIECIKIASGHLPGSCLEALNDLNNCYLNDRIKAKHIGPIADKIENEWSKVYMPRESRLQPNRKYMQKHYAIRACKRLIDNIHQEWDFRNASTLMDVSRAMSTDNFYCYKTFNRMADICRYNLTSSVMQKLARM